MHTQTSHGRSRRRAEQATFISFDSRGAVNNHEPRPALSRGLTQARGSYASSPIANGGGAILPDSRIRTKLPCGANVWIYAAEPRELALPVALNRLVGAWARSL